MLRNWGLVRERQENTYQNKEKMAGSATRRRNQCDGGTDSMGHSDSTDVDTGPGKSAERSG